MAKRQARRSASGNVGRSGRKVVASQAKRASGQVQVTVYSTGRVDFTPPISYTYGNNSGFICGFNLQPGAIFSIGNTKLRWSDAAEDGQEAKPARKNALADSRGMEAAEKGSAKGKPTVSPSGRIHPGNRPAGKQRAQSGMVASGHEKAGRVDSRRSGKIRATDRGAAK